MKAQVWDDDTITILPVSKRRKGWFIGKHQLTNEETERLQKHLLGHERSGARIDLLQENDGLHYLPIELPKGGNEINDLLDDDLYRAFEQGVRNTRELTKSKWDRLIKAGVIFFSLLFAVGGFLLFMVMLNKGTADFGSSFSGIIKQMNITGNVMGVFGG